VSNAEVRIKFINENLVEVRGADGATQARLVTAHRTHRLVKRVLHLAAGTFQVHLEPMSEHSHPQARFR
jgi:hypothetical protein